MSRGVFRGAKGQTPPPWSSKIYVFQGVLGLNGCRPPPPGKKKNLDPLTSPLSKREKCKGKNNIV